MCRPVANWLLYSPFILIYILYVRPGIADGSGSADMVTEAIGLLLILIGLVIRIVSRQWKVSYCPKGLVTTGPYSVVRNPMYIGSYFLGLGMCALIGNGLFATGFTVVYWIVHHLVVLGEERDLMKEWPEDYAGFMKSVPRWIPSVPALMQYLRTYKAAKLRVAIVRELGTICGAFMGAALVEAREDYLSRGMELARGELQILIPLSGVLLLVGMLSSVSPIKWFLRGDRHLQQPKNR